MRDFKLYIIGSALYLQRTDNNNSLFATDALQVDTTWITLNSTADTITITSTTDQADVENINIADLEDNNGLEYEYTSLERFRNANFL